MALSSSVVGESGPDFAATLDARWAMAYAAALGETDAGYFDTGAASLAVHPLFPICVEWLPQTRTPGQAVPLARLTMAEALRSVHYSYDLTLHRPLVGRLEVRVAPVVVAVRRHRAGALLTTRFTAVDHNGAPVWTSYSTGLLRDTGVAGPDRVADAAPPVPPLRRDDPVRLNLPVDAGFAHVYSECARIWNPIHTDVAVARAAGLPNVILHGSATLALAVSRAVAIAAPGHPTAVRRIVGTFGAMVPLPSTLHVEVTATAEGSVAFSVLTDGGRPAVRNGLVMLGLPGSEELP